MVKTARFPLLSILFVILAQDLPFLSTVGNPDKEISLIVPVSTVAINFKGNWSKF